jgi:CheY-like chemotaxis protein
MNVFVSYQRADTLFAAHALAYALRLHYHDAFVDTGSIASGEQYRQVIGEAVSKANVFLALIGASFDAARLHEPTSVIAFEWQRARRHNTAVVPVLVDGHMPKEEQLPSWLRWFTSCNAVALRQASLSADIDACVAAIPALATIPRRAARVLWIDDRPANNEYERKWLRGYGLVFDNVVSTDEALEQLANDTYDLVITDLGRRGSSDRSSTAGAAFLENPIVRSGPPVIVYADRKAEAQAQALRDRGAREMTADRERLFEIVLDLLGCGPEPAGELRR